MPNDRLALWKSEPSAHDAAIRGWSKRSSETKSARFASLVVPEGLTRYNTKASHVFHGTATSLVTSLPRLTKRGKCFSQEKELAEIAIVLQNRT